MSAKPGIPEVNYLLSQIGGAYGLSLEGNYPIVRYIAGFAGDLLSVLNLDDREVDVRALTGELRSGTVPSTGVDCSNAWCRCTGQRTW